MRLSSCRRLPWLFTAAFVAAAFLDASAGQPVQVPGRPTFSAGVELVEVAVSVTDDDGRAVRDLTVDDFEVYEDGLRQPLVAFAHVDTPVEPFDVPVSHPPPDAAAGAPGERAGRVYLLLLDDLHTHALRTEEVRAIAREFIERTLLANDVAAVAVTSGRAPAQHFTSSRRRLLEAADRFVGGYVPGRSLFSRPSIETFTRPPGAGGESVGREQETRAWNARLALRSVERFAEWMGGIDARRKAIILIGQGIDYLVAGSVVSRDATLQMAGDTLDRLDAMSRAASAAARHDVTLYAIDPRGLPTGARSSIQTRVLAGERSSSQEAWREKESLRSLAEATGGFALVNSNRFAEALERIAREQSTYYLLGYRPPRAAPDDRLHRIRVRIDRPGMTVRARRGYVHGAAPDEPDDVAAQLSALLEGPLPQPGLRIELAGLPLRGADASVAPVVVAVRLEPLRHGDGPPAADLVLTVVAADEDGTELARRTVDVFWPAEMHGVVQEHGLRVLCRLDLPGPGRVHLRAAVVERRTGALGSVHHEMDVPDLRSASIAMSGLAVNPGSPVPTLTAGPGSPNVLPFPPAARRVFDAEDSLAVFAEVYVNGPHATRQPRARRRGRVDRRPAEADESRPKQLRLASVIRNAAGEIVLQGSERSLAVDTATSYLVSLPLAHLGPGAYVLSVGALDEESGSRVARRVPFRVR